MIKYLMRYIPDVLAQTVARMGITWVFMSVVRLLFYVNNYIHFQNVKLNDFIAGMWFDAIAIGIWFIPFYGLSLFPNPLRDKALFRYLLLFLFHVTNAIMLGLNLLDVSYFEYTSKRSTADLFTVLSAGEDFSQLIGTFILDFWWLFLIWFALIFLSHQLYKKTQSLARKTSELSFFSWWKASVTFVLGFAILFIMGRGGLGYRPADMLTAAQFTAPSKTALVTNTPLSIIKTFGKSALREKNYFDEDELADLFNPVQQFTGKKSIHEQANVVVIILESFGNEWLGKKRGTPFTPFLDSLLDHSLYFSNAFANGKKSIEAMPAIFAGIPTLMDNPYISSHYGTNQIEGLPMQLKKMGYSSAFFHGATNGSMKFDEFANLVGFDHYFGRNEYGNELHCDDTWGVLDEYFNPWTAKKITETLNPPFLAGLFTLSSHHPYYIPESHRASLPDGPHPIAKSIAYGDMALRLFFEQAKKEPWFNNTIFILCADHTPAGTIDFYTNRVGMYQIPIAIYSPIKWIKPGVNDRVFSHIDIPPTILALLGYSEAFYGFGQPKQLENKRFTVNYIEGIYHFYDDNYLLNFSQDRAVNLYNYRIDSLLWQDSILHLPEKADQMERQLKGIIQRYNFDLINNKMLP